MDFINVLGSFVHYLNYFLIMVITEIFLIDLFFHWTQQTTTSHRIETFLFVWRLCIRCCQPMFLNFVQEIKLVWRPGRPARAPPNYLSNYVWYIKYKHNYLKNNAKKYFRLSHTQYAWRILCRSLNVGFSVVYNWIIRGII